MTPETPFDVIVVGGSYAGMAAALQVARARRRVAVIDAGVRRNRFAPSSHGFLGQDGRAPEAIAAEARAQLLRYPGLTWIEGSAATAQVTENGFSVTLEAGTTYQAGRLVLATGVIDELPELPGLAERWGRSVFHCPYCHGYELDNGRIGVIGAGPMSMHQALMLPDWGQVTFFTRGVMELDEAQLASLRERGVTVDPTPILAVSGDGKPIVELEDGRAVPMDGLFVASRTHLASPLAAQLGCAVDESPIGFYIRTDETKETTVPGVFACGDAGRMAGTVSMAVGDGAMAGTAAHRSLLFNPTLGR